MDDPVRDIHGVVHDLCQTDPRTQAATIDKYFGPQAQFKHPFCQAFNNRTLIHYIFRWYKIMSPHIDLNIKSVAYDADNLLLYISLHQTFRIFFLPLHRSRVNLTTVLTLTHLNPATFTHEPDKYYIAEQNDLYQVDEFIRFVLPWFNLGPLIVLVWHAIATFFCVVGCVAGFPVTLLEQRWADEGRAKEGKGQGKVEGEGTTAGQLRGQVERVLVNGSRDGQTAGGEQGKQRFGNMNVVTAEK